MIPRTPRRPDGARPSCRHRRGQAAVAGLFWLLAISLFALPFALGRQDVPNWKADDDGRKLEYHDPDEEVPNDVLDLPFLADLDSLEEYAAEADWGLGDFDAEISAASLRHFGRDYRGYFAPDHETFADEFVDDASEPFGTRSVPSAPIDAEAAASTGLFEVSRLEPGERTYIRQCAGCHGLAGDGGGPSASYLDPRPRNFRKGHFKFTTTPWGSRPRREDLYRTITRGLVGSAMPRFHLLPEEKRWDVVEYVRFMAAQGEFEQTMLTYAELEEGPPDVDEVLESVVEAWQGLDEQYPASEEPPADDASVARGRELFQTNCANCHGEGGKGDGPSADEFLDAWGYPIRPRDLTTGQLRVGLEGKDLWVLLAHGIKGTPMPGYLGAVSSEDIWHLVHFVQEVASGNGGN